MEIEKIGKFNFDEKYECYFSDLIKINAFDNKEFKFIIDNYDEKYIENYKTAILNIINLKKEILYEVNDELFKYYKDSMDYFNNGLNITKPEDVWSHISIGNKFFVCLRNEDYLVYISLECNCDWEEEHGLQIVFKNGFKINKIGPYDGHLTNSDAYARDEFENKIYVSQKDF